jgi:hypothetical protein
MKVVIHSRKVPIYQEIDIPYPNFLGPAFHIRRRIITYTFTLDEEQKQTLEQAREIAEYSGLRLEVIDLAFENMFKRLLRRLAVFTIKTPLVIFHGSVLGNLLRFSMKESNPSLQKE